MLSCSILGLAAGAHLVAGGALPAWPIMIAILALHTMVATFATKFRLSLTAMTALLATSQVVLHRAFEALSHSGPTALLKTGGHGALHSEAHSASMLVQAMPLAEQTADTVGHASFSGSMLAAHIAASLLTAALLAYGEKALWALANWLQPLCKRAAVVQLLPAANPGAARTPRPLPRLPWRNIRPDTRRGPPLQSELLS